MPNIRVLIVALFFVVGTMTQSEAAGSCAPPPATDVELCGEGGWVAYQRQKCYKLLPGLHTKSQAESLCAAQTTNSCPSILIQIRFVDEQRFLEKFIFDTSHVTTSVWTSGVREDANEFGWPHSFFYDPTTIKKPWCVNYLNLKPSPSNKTNCLGMLSGTTDHRQRGKWIDQSCEAQNAVVCEKPQALTLENLREQMMYDRRLNNAAFTESNIIAETAAVSAEFNYERIVNLQKNPVPIGFIYAQLSGQANATTLWPMCTWQEVAANYSVPVYQVDTQANSSWTLWKRIE